MKLHKGDVGMFKIGEATITRVEETNVPGYMLRDIFKELTDAQMAEHKHWLAPHHYEAAPAGSSCRCIAGCCRSAARRS